MKTWSCAYLSPQTRTAPGLEIFGKLTSVWPAPYRPPLPPLPASLVSLMPCPLCCLIRMARRFSWYSNNRYNNSTMVFCHQDTMDMFKTRPLICLRAMPYKGREEKGDKSGHWVCLGPRIPPLRRSTHLPVRLSNNLCALHANNLNIDIRTSVNIF